MQRFVIWLFRLVGLEFCKSCGAFVNTRGVNTAPEDADYEVKRVLHDQAVCFGVRRSDLGKLRIKLDDTTDKARRALELGEDGENSFLAQGAWNREADRQLQGLTRIYNDLRGKVSGLRLGAPSVDQNPPPVEETVNGSGQPVGRTYQMPRADGAMEYVIPTPPGFLVERDLYGDGANVYPCMIFTEGQLKDFIGALQFALAKNTAPTDNQ